MLLHDTTVALLAADGIEQETLASCREQLEQHGVTVMIAAQQLGEVRALDADDQETRVQVDITFDELQETQYQGLILLPYTSVRPYQHNLSVEVLEIVHRFFAAGCIIAALGEAVAVAIAADIVRQRRITCQAHHYIWATDAGAIWMADDLVIDNGLVTAKTTPDISHFIHAIEEELRQGTHQRADTII